MSDDEITPQLLTAQQIATLLAISKRQIWRLADRGVLPGRITIGRLTRWRKDLINKWVAAGCPGA